MMWFKDHLVLVREVRPEIRMKIEIVYCPT